MNNGKKFVDKKILLEGDIENRISLLESALGKLWAFKRVKRNNSDSRFWETNYFILDISTKTQSLGNIRIPINTLILRLDGSIGLMFNNGFLMDSLSVMELERISFGVHNINEEYLRLVLEG